MPHHTSYNIHQSFITSQCTCYWRLLDSVKDEALLPGAVRRCWQLAQSYHCHVMSQWSCTASAIAARAPRAISTTTHNNDTQSAHSGTCTLCHIDYNTTKFSVLLNQQTWCLSINQSKLPVFSLVFYLNDWQHTKCFSNVPELILLW